MPLQTCTIGYPRIGPNREMKKALESFWSNSIGKKELLDVHRGVMQQAWKAQKDAGIDIIGIDGTLYDQVLDMCILLNLVPKRFQEKSLEGTDLYFAMARGLEGTVALDMSKYFNTNYHYLVPEVDSETVPELKPQTLVEKVKLAQMTVGAESAVPMIIGPVTMARLATLSAIDIPQFVQKLMPVYQQLLQTLVSMKVHEVQILEPALAMYDAPTFRCIYEDVYGVLGQLCKLNIVTFYDDVGACYPWLVQLPVAAISLDFCGVIGAAEACESLKLLQEHGFPANKVLGAGVIDGRNIWADRGHASALVSAIQKATKAPVRIQSSCSLQHVPIDKVKETKMPEDLLKKLAFANQKLVEMSAIAAGQGEKGGSVHMATNTPTLKPGMFNRPAEYSQRRTVQFKAQPGIPNFPTTTIGSFPQTQQIRKVRANFKAGRLSAEEHDRAMDTFIAHTIGVQEALGLDVLVHGEPERSDMVEYFGQFLEGIVFSQHAWVQSYGSRYVRPPIIYGDVSRPNAMTVREFKVAQELTEKPVKGMLTGPVTVLNWSFPRNDVSRSTTAFQLALALREEVADLEAAGCSIIQVDEPALREGLPLKKQQWPGYLKWAVDAFRLTCAVAAPETQIVTHLCYSEFEDILPAIDRLDADVLTIENARSSDAMIVALQQAGYGRDIGAGVYDVHSPAVPSVNFMADRVKSFMATGILDCDPRRIWVNPDCGLKTRKWKEVMPSLRNMVDAAVTMRGAVA